jgi:hypothetical protein
MLEQLYKILPTFTPNTSLVPLDDILEEFIDSVYLAMDALIIRTCTALQRIFLYYDSEDSFTPEFKEKLTELKHKKATEWITKMSLL